MVRRLFVHQAADVAVAQGVEQGPGLWHTTFDWQAECELVNHLVDSDLTDVEAVLRNALVNVAVRRAANLFEVLLCGSLNLALALNGEDSDENFSCHPLRQLFQTLLADWEDEQLGKVRVAHVCIRS